MAVESKDSPDLPLVLAGLCGTVLEQRYEIVRVLGAGGMGAVFEARHLRLDRPVAIKVLKPALAGESEYNERFLREAKSATKVRHRNVVEILDYGETAAGLLYSVMEFLVGQDLEQLLDEQPQGRLPWARARALLVQIASGLRAAHREGVVHRDIKPANCFITHEDDEPLVKLVDFGIAKLSGSERGPTLTGTAQVLGTPSYIAPEMIRTAQPAGPQSDIYSLGVMAYRMLTGRVPFAGETVFELLRKACFDPVPPLREIVPEVPPAVEEFVLTLLAKDPQARPSDMQQVRQGLLALEEEIPAVPSGQAAGASVPSVAVGRVPAGSGVSSVAVGHPGSGMSPAAVGHPGSDMSTAAVGHGPPGSGVSPAAVGHRLPQLGVGGELGPGVTGGVSVGQASPHEAMATGPEAAARGVVGGAVGHWPEGAAATGHAAGVDAGLGVKAPTSPPGAYVGQSPGGSIAGNGAVTAWASPASSIAKPSSQWSETLPTAGESTLSGADASKVVTRSRGRGAWWLGVAGLLAAAVGVLGGRMLVAEFASPSSAEGDPTRSGMSVEERTEPSSAASAEAPAGADENPAGVAENLAGVAENLAGVAENPAGVAENPTGVAENPAGVVGNPTGADGSSAEIVESVAEIDGAPAEADGSPAGAAENSAGMDRSPAGAAKNSAGMDGNPAGVAENPAVLGAEPGSLSERSGEAKSDPLPVDLSSASAESPSAVSSSAEPPPTTSPPADARPKRTGNSARSSGPPSDAKLVKRLERRIKSKCIKSPGDGPVIMTFLVTTDGNVMGITASPAGPVGQCAKSQVKGVKFRTRSSRVPLKIHAK
ncbi:MAG: protein kinase [Myxococcota bacterium]